MEERILKHAKASTFDKFADGEATQYAIRKISVMEAQATEDALLQKEYIDLLDTATPLRDGIQKRIVQLGYSGNLEDIAGQKKFVLNKYHEHAITPPSGPTLRSWLSGAKMPAGSSTGRENVFRLCFALEMDAVKTAEFFLKSYLSRPFNYKNTKEAVFFYCLLNGKDYNDALRIITAVEKIQPDGFAGRETETEHLGNQIAAFREEADFIRYLSGHRYSEKEQHLTAAAEIDKLLQSCYHLASKETAYTKEKAKDILSEDALLDVIYDYDAYIMKSEENLTIQDSRLPKVLKTNWLDRQSFQNIKVRGKISDDVYRKALILLTFYKFYAMAYLSQRKKRNEADIDLREYSGQFMDQLDSTLSKCGYVQSYNRNPFDWVILNCASYPNPLTQFRDIIYEFFLYETYPESEE